MLHNLLFWTLSNIRKDNWLNGRVGHFNCWYQLWRNEVLNNSDIYHLPMTANFQKSYSHFTFFIFFVGENSPFAIFVPFGGRRRCSHTQCWQQKTRRHKVAKTNDICMAMSLIQKLRGSGYKVCTGWLLYGGPVISKAGQAAFLLMILAFSTIGYC